MKFNPKHIDEAIQAGVELIGEGKDANSKLYLIKECGHEQILYIQSVRNKKFTCSICLENKLKKEAKEQNLEFIEVDNKAGVGIYRFKECGHTQKIQYSAVRNGEFRCKTCNEMQYHIEAKDAELELIGPGRNTSTRLYKFKSCEHEQIISMHEVRNKQFMCRECQLEKLSKEAKLVGLTLIGKVKNPNNRIYKFNECGHEQEINSVCVRRNTFQCNTCLDEKYVKEAERVGLILIGPGHEYPYNIYRFKECGHTQQIRIPEVRINKFKCQTCADIQYKTEAEKANLEIIGESKKDGYKIYRFKKCGHIQEIRMDGVRNEDSTVRCKQCQEDKYNQEADKVGLILIGEVRIDYKKYRFKECGHTQEIQPGDVRLNNFKCRACVKIKYEREVNEAGLELLDEGDTFSARLYKIKSCGHTQRINIDSVRNKSFRCGSCFEEKIKKEAEEAEEAELELIGSGKNAEYRLYRLKNCGHMREIKTYHVRTKSFKCAVCKGMLLKNGEIVKSNLEKIIGNWLIYNDIKFEYEKRLSSKSLHKTDFYIYDLDIYLEVAGYIDEIEIKNNLNVYEIIESIKSDKKNYRNYRDKLIDKINRYYLDKKLIALTKKNIIECDWQKKLEVELSHLSM